MSSTYQVICVEHAPALIVGDEYTSPSDALRAASAPGRYPELEYHKRCDLLVGRFSYPLIQVACPGFRGESPSVSPANTCKYHGASYDNWTEVAWLRLLYDAIKDSEDVHQYRVPACWTRNRVIRLGNLLQTEEWQP